MVKESKILKSPGWVIVGGTVLAGAGWLAFVPSAQEPGYEFVKPWGGSGTGTGEFNDPTGIAVAKGQVFLANSRNGRIEVFDLDCAHKRQFGMPGDAPGGVAVAEDGDLFVADFYNHRDLRLAADGAFLGQ